jgi:hypothetical protein
VYTAHVFTELAVVEYVWRVWPPAAVRMALVAADVAALGLLCAAVERRLPQRALAWLAAPRAPARALGPRLAATLAAAAVAAAIGLGWRAARPGVHLEPAGGEAEVLLEFDALPLEGGPVLGSRDAPEGPDGHAAEPEPLDEDERTGWRAAPAVARA